MLKSVKLQFSETGTLDLSTKGIIIFVGPNNSGKSLVLREIETIISQQPPPANLNIVVDFDIDWPSEEIIDKQIAIARSRTPSTAPAGNIFLGRINPNGGREEIQVDEPTIRSIAKEKSNKGWFSTHYVKWGVLRLDGRSRFNLTNDQNGGDLGEPAINVLSHLFQDDKSRNEVRKIIKSAFNLNFYIDPTRLGSLRIKLSPREMQIDEQSLSEAARAFYKEATYIKDSSDGVQAFTGIITAVLSGEFHTILIDEPEAFLHPPLARKLGIGLATLASSRNGTLMASTHSADFLMGCVQGSSSVQVVRLEYSDGKSRARSIDPQILESFLKRSLMRSANVISGLFHDGVIVLESDNDRAFYSEIYHRISDGKPDYPSILFINAQNKQTIREIVGPLRKFGVPAAAISDIDIVKDGGQNWTHWLKAANIPSNLHSGFGQQRSEVCNSLIRSGRDMKTDGGINILSGDDLEAAKDLFDNLEQYGIFLVRLGELECWLQSLGVSGKKADWAVAMLERLGSDPSASDYVPPANDDVWEFLERIVKWISNSARKGTG